MKRPWWRWTLEYLVLMAGFGPVLLMARFIPLVWALAGWFVYMVISRVTRWPSPDFWNEINKWAE
jgi:hypothetical protein